MNWIFRTDVGDGVGLGHFVRDLALAREASAQGARPHFVLSGDHKAAREFLEQYGFEYVVQPGPPGEFGDRQFTQEFAARVDASVVIVDGYRFPESFFRFDRTVVAIDERSISPPVQIFVDIDPDAEAKPRNLREARLLSGPEFALLRPDFVVDGEPREFADVVERVLVMLGGEDIRGQTDLVLDGLEIAGFDGVAVVISNESPVQRSFSVEHHDFVEDVAAMMRSIDLAFTACGGTVWELCATGTPACVVVSAENQCSIGQWVNDKGVAVNLGWWAELRPEDVAGSFSRMNRSARLGLSRAGRKFIDGRGANRVVQAIREVQ